MPIGPGLYDDLCVRALLETNASATIVLILGGDKGTGFSINMRDARVAFELPALLRSMADGIEADLRPQGQA